MKKILLIIIIAVSTACGKTREAEVKPQEVVKEVVTMDLNLTEEEDVKNYNGELMPLKEVTHITETGGDVVTINFKNGDTVNKGDTIMILEDNATTSKYLKTKGDLIKTDSDYRTKKTSYDKYKTLFEKELVSEDAYLTVKNELSESKGNLEVAEALYKEAKSDYDDLVVRSRISGTITDLDLKKYEKTETGKKLFTVVDTNKMEVSIGVSVDDIGKIDVGTRAVLKATGRNIHGSIEEINYSSDSNTKTYETKVVVDNPEKKLLKGMYSKVNIAMGEVEGYFVPKEAVMIKDMYNYIALERDGKAMIYKVELGIVAKDKQQVLLEDIQDGDRVVVQGQYLLQNNDNLKEA